MTAQDLADYRDHLQAIRDVFGDCTVEKLVFTTSKGDKLMSFFKFNKEDIGDSFELLPKGRYQAVVMDHEWKANKAGTGHLLNLTFEIVNHEEFDGRKLWASLNLDNQSEAAQKIALRDFRSLCVAAGAEVLFDAAFEAADVNVLAKTLEDMVPFDLYTRPVELTVDVEQGGGEYPDKNRIRGYAKVLAPVAKASGFKR